MRAAAECTAKLERVTKCLNIEERDACSEYVPCAAIVSLLSPSLLSEPMMFRRLESTGQKTKSQSPFKEKEPVPGTANRLGAVE